MSFQPRMTEEDAHMGSRGLTTSMPIWVRVPGIIALILVGVLASAMLVGATGLAGNGRMGGMNHNNQNQNDQNDQNHGPSRHSCR
jgi:hypothetical protein